MEVCRNDDDLGFLLMRFNQRDTSAFATIYMDFFTELHVYANRLYCNTSESAADAVQEAFCYLWERHDVIFDSLTKIKAFLFVAIKNRYKNHVNHLGVRQKYKDAMERETSFVEDVLDSELATSLLEYVEYIPDPERDTDKPFLMPVEDVFTITGRGTVATGRVERGTLHLNDELEILGVKEDVLKTVVTGIEMFRKQLDEAMAGDNIGALLRGVNRDQIVRGQVLAKPGTVTCHHKFTAQVYVLTKDEGGRHTPFFNNYRPQFYFRTTDVTGVCELPAGTEMCMPGDNVEMTIELIHPVAMEQGLTFAIREGGRTVGSGRVATIIE